MSTRDMIVLPSAFCVEREDVDRLIEPFALVFLTVPLDLAVVPDLTDAADALLFIVFERDSDPFVALPAPTTPALATAL